MRFVTQKSILNLGVFRILLCYGLAEVSSSCSLGHLGNWSKDVKRTIKVAQLKLSHFCALMLHAYANWWGFDCNTMTAILSYLNSPSDATGCSSTHLENISMGKVAKRRIVKKEINDSSWSLRVELPSQTLQTCAEHLPFYKHALSLWKKTKHTNTLHHHHHHQLWE